MFKAFFFDMDGVLFNSMPRHAKAWSEVMSRHGLQFSQEDCYMQEGRTGKSVIDECILRDQGRHATDEECEQIYSEKSQLFHSLGEPQPIDNVTDVLSFLREKGAQIFIVTGSGQKSLLDNLDARFPGYFVRERMVTAFDVKHGKPDPEPYLIAYEKAKANAGGLLAKDECCVVENAPLGVRAGKAAGIYTIGVNTGPLPDAVLAAEGADQVLPNMLELLRFLQAE